MKAWFAKHSKIIILLTALILLSAGGFAIYCSYGGDEAELTYKETTAEYGTLKVGITEKGQASISTLDQEFALDISEYKSSSSSSSNKNNNRFPGGFGSMDRQNSTSKRTVEVEEVLVKVGQKVTEGTPLFTLNNEVVDEVRHELEKDLSDALLAYEKRQSEQKTEKSEARHELEVNRVYGESAEAEYNEAQDKLYEAAEEAQEALADATEELADLEEDLAELKKKYEESKAFLKELEAAVSEEKDTYWYLRNSEMRDSTKKDVDNWEDDLEKLEDEVRDKRYEIISLTEAWDEAVKAYYLGEVTNGLAREQRLYKLGNADAIYRLASDKTEYEEKITLEDYTDAKEKLERFDVYLKDYTVKSEYDGVVTAVTPSKGSRLSEGSALITVNSFSRVTIHVDVDDDDLEEIKGAGSVAISFEAFPDSTFYGKVTDIGDSTVDSSSQVTYDVEVTVDGDISGIYQDMSAEVTFVTDEVRSVVHIPNRALYEDEAGGKYVYVYDADGNVIKKAVVSGFTDGSRTQIKEGLSEGDTILIVRENVL